MPLQNPIQLADGTLVARGDSKANVTWNRWYHTIANLLQGSAGAANAGQVSGTVNDGSGNALTVKRVVVVAAAATTDVALIPLVTGKAIRVLSLIADTGGTATTLTFNNKPAGAGTLNAGPFSNAISESLVWNWNPGGWLQTTLSNGLSVTTGAGSATTFVVNYVEVG